MKNEYEQELLLLQQYGIKENPLRLEYEQKVRALKQKKEEMLAAGMSAGEIAPLLHQERRELGRIYKEAAPPLFREYIYEATAKKYKDPLGPSYEQLRIDKTPEEIMESACRPIRDLNNRLTLEGFREWYIRTDKQD